ncbi:hypothetical protein GQ43DRAFT_445479 [Delitschia confertaspora ATCC 74209]|uniref:RanBP2-type domain-containing protein n=1 Tax=Delitschia confertaspora ATCC 74209 TaxID=1513339 RepID=A0A9P4JD07_9PLEO|nr:hypothetical protein GQ43DRAFT_445479 [Delitschia confertaspora ATCC 74209]
MDIPRGHAMLPLTLLDLYDFLFNYFKAEYAPIRSIFSTATAIPHQPSRWLNMGHELVPLTFRPAHAQAQKDLESLEQFAKEKGLDSWFIKGIVIRFAKYDGHERLEKKLFESGRADLMVKKALKERHLIESLWPSPPRQSSDRELVRQGAQVRSWYADMFGKYFRYLHAVDDFGFKPEIDQKIKGIGHLNLVPSVEHLVLGDAAPIVPVVAKGAGFNYSQRPPMEPRRRDRNEGLGKGYGEPGRFEIRLDAPTSIEETQTRSVVRQTECLVCGTKRDVTVAISIDPAPGSASSKAATGSREPNRNASARRQSKAAQRAPASPQSSTQQPEPQPPLTESTKYKQCPRCTFLNHPDLADCEMCGADLPESTVVSRPSSPEQSTKRKASGPLHSVSLPENQPSNQRDESSTPGLKPAAAPNRHSLSSTLFSIFPFSGMGQEQHKQNQKAEGRKREPSREKEMTEGGNSSKASEACPADTTPTPKHQDSTSSQDGNHASHAEREESESESSYHEAGQSSNSSPRTPPFPNPFVDLADTPLDQPPDMNLMPLTPPEQPTRPFHIEGLPQHLMDDYVPASPGLPDENEVEEAGWGELRKQESRQTQESDDDYDDENQDAGPGGRRRRAFVELDEVGREEMGIWGEDER